MSHIRKGYYVVMTDNNTNSGNIGSHSEFQDGHQVLNNTRLNPIYHNEGHDQLSTYPKRQNMAENIIFAGFIDSHFEFSVNQDPWAFFSVIIGYVIFIDMGIKTRISSLSIPEA